MSSVSAFFMFEAGKIAKGDGMKYNNLKSLLETSSSARKYFLSLPVSLQITLHSQNQYIHSLEQLHRYAYLAQGYERHCQISDGK